MQDLEWKYRRRRARDRWWTPNLEAKAWVVAIPKAFDPYAQPIFFSFVLLKLSADHSTWENIDPTVGLSSLTKTQERRSFQALWQSPHSTCQADLFRYFTPDQYESSLVMETHIIVFLCFSAFQGKIEENLFKYGGKTEYHLSINERPESCKNDCVLRSLANKRPPLYNSKKLQHRTSWIHWHLSSHQKPTLARFLTAGGPNVLGPNWNFSFTMCISKQFLGTATTGSTGPTGPTGSAWSGSASTSDSTDPELSLAVDAKDWLWQFSRSWQFMLRSWIGGSPASKGDTLGTNGSLLISSRSTGITGRLLQGELLREAAFCASSFGSYQVKTHHGTDGKSLGHECGRLVYCFCHTYKEWKRKRLEVYVQSDYIAQLHPSSRLYITECSILQVPWSVHVPPILHESGTLPPPHTHGGPRGPGFQRNGGPPPHQGSKWCPRSAETTASLCHGSSGGHFHGWQCRFGRCRRWRFS